MYFVSFSVSEGNVFNSRYKSSISCAAVYGSAISTNYLAATTACSGSYNLFIYDTSLFSFTVMSFAGIAFQLEVEYSIGRLIIVGKYSNNGYISKFLFESIVNHSDFTQSLVSMITLATGVNDIVDEIGATISASISASASLNTYVNQSVSYSLNSIVKSDVSFEVDTQSILIVENNKVQITPNLS